jgi:putative oxidoreductase
MDMAHGAVDDVVDTATFVTPEGMMDIIVLVGRILFAFVFLTSGYAHFASRKMMAPYAASKGVPAAMPAVLAGGVLLLAGSVSVLLGIWADLGALLLVIFLVPTAVMMHGFWKETDPQARQNELIQFSKDTALAGAALMLFAFFSLTGDSLGLTITGPLFDSR